MSPLVLAPRRLDDQVVAVTAANEKLYVMFEVSTQRDAVIV